VVKTHIAAEPQPITVELDHTALVIIDMQRDFLEPGGFGESLGNDVSRLQAVVKPLQAVLAAARAVSMLVIHTREGHRPDLSDAPPAKIERGSPSKRIGDAGPMGRILIRGEPGHDIIPELFPIAGEPVIDKPGKGAFYQTDLELTLRNCGIENLIVTGVTTEVCVNTTVREANDRSARSADRNRRVSMAMAGGKSRISSRSVSDRPRLKIGRCLAIGRAISCLGRRTATSRPWLNVIPVT
jgi:nicotinamidase-related amidase